MNKVIGGLTAGVFLASVVLMNWLTQHWGGVVTPNGDHLVPVGFGLLTTSGTYAAGLTLVARDLTQRTLGRWPSLVIIPAGAALTWLFSPSLAVASVTAFAIGETLDFLVYTPLRNRGLVLAVLASSIIGGAVDTVVFLSLAGIPMLALAGTLLGKFYVEVGSAPVVRLFRRVVS